MFGCFRIPELQPGSLRLYVLGRLWLWFHRAVDVKYQRKSNFLVAFTFNDLVPWPNVIQSNPISLVTNWASIVDVQRKGMARTTVAEPFRNYAFLYEWRLFWRWCVWKQIHGWCLVRNSNLSLVCGFHSLHSPRRLNLYWFTVCVDHNFLL